MRRNLMTTIISPGPAILPLWPSPLREFPEMPGSITDGKRFNVPKFKLRAMIDQTLFAVAQNDAKPVYTGSCCLRQGTGIDRGFGWTVTGWPYAGKIDSDEELRLLLCRADPFRGFQTHRRRGGRISPLPFSRKHIVFSIDSYHVISRAGRGIFLDYNATIPLGKKPSARDCGTRAFCDSIERTSPSSTTGFKGPLSLSLRLT